MKTKRQVGKKGASRVRGPKTNAPEKIKRFRCKIPASTPNGVGVATPELSTMNVGRILRSHTRASTSSMPQNVRRNQRKLNPEVVLVRLERLEDSTQSGPASTSSDSDSGRNVSPTSGLTINGVKRGIKRRRSSKLTPLVTERLKAHIDQILARDESPTEPVDERKTSKRRFRKECLSKVSQASMESNSNQQTVYGSILRSIYANPDSQDKPNGNHDNDNNGFSGDRNPHDNSSGICLPSSSSDYEIERIFGTPKKPQIPEDQTKPKESRSRSKSAPRNPITSTRGRDSLISSDSDSFYVTPPESFIINGKNEDSKI